jgi:hypothetical protein
MAKRIELRDDQIIGLEKAIVSLKKRLTRATAERHILALWVEKNGGNVDEIISATGLITEGN